MPIADIRANHGCDAQKANARLIAAAPELLAALELLTAAGEAGLWGAWASNTPNGRILDSSRAAIAKAQGQ